MLSAHFCSAQSVILNEWMAKNSTTLQDEDGDFSDWVEIYNSGTSAVDLNGYGLSDDEAEPYKWIFPTTVLQPTVFVFIRVHSWLLPIVAT